MPDNKNAEPAKAGHEQSVRDIAESYDEFPVSLVVTDPRLPDNPIVYVNRAFTELTGYSASVACGRNCRFLQGPDTDARPVRELSEAIAEDRPAAVELVNYTSTGDRFLNHLVITPIRDNGQTIFFMGVQAGWREDGDTSPPLDDLTRHLARLEDTIKGQVGTLLSIVREEVAEPSEPREVITLLSSRIDCLAQLYAGVFRRHSRHTGEPGTGLVRLGAYLGRVCSGTHTADRSYNVRLSTNFVEATAEVETAAMIGLTLSELLANAFGDANPYDDEAEIEVDLRWSESGAANLRVKASSRGEGGSLLPENKSVGRRLLRNLLPRLGTTLEEANRDGVREVVMALPMITRPDARDASASKAVPKA